MTAKIHAEQLLEQADQDLVSLPPSTQPGNLLTPPPPVMLRLGSPSSAMLTLHPAFGQPGCRGGACKRLSNVSQTDEIPIL